MPAPATSRPRRLAMPAPAPAPPAPPYRADNTSALAALTKGYSGLPDSARLVHVYHAWAAVTRAHVWFEYVPSDANVADLPSRDMTLANLAMET